MKAPKEATKFLWRPRQMSLFYVCEDQEIHEVSGLLWGKRLWRRKDRKLFPIAQIAPLVYGFGRAGEAEGPVDTEGKPVIQ